MMRSIVLFIAAAATINAQSPLITKRATATATAEPCAIVSASLANLRPSDPVLVPAKVAYDCLNSVPLDKEGDLLQISELQDYLQWQTTLQYLKNPPANYTEKPVDIMGGLDEISQGIENGTYTNEYQVQFDIRNLLIQARDGHLGYAPDILDVLGFSRLTPIVSLSKDGIALPELYIEEDLDKIAGGETFNASSIKLINGQNATAYVENLSLGVSQNQDPDTRFNVMFPNQASRTMGSSAGAFSGGLYDGATTNFTFNNGSTYSVNNIASTEYDFSGVDSGDAFFAKFCNGPAATQTLKKRAAAASNSTSTVIPSATGYPLPVVIHSGLVVGGYYLEDSDYADVAVLSIPSYEPEGNGSDVEFQSVVRSFLADAVKQDKKKLIVDVRGNGGGLVNLGFDTFKQLFPDIEPYGASKWRAHEAHEIIAATAADIVNNVTLAEQDPDGVQKVLSSLEFYTYPFYNDINNVPFATFKDYYGPHTIDADRYLSVQRNNFSLPFTAGNFSVTGYLNNTNVAPQPFAANDIVILSDGVCASTCTVFGELMREQGGVTTVSIGGEARNAPMQAIGGTRGAQTLMFSNINNAAVVTIEAVEAVWGEDTASRVNDTVVGTLAYPQQVLRRVAYDASGVTSAQVNAQDNLRRNDTAEIPLQFVPEAADCKIFNSIAGHANVTEVWKLVADVKWGNKACVPGSTGDPTAISSEQNEAVFNNKTLNLQQNQQKGGQGSGAGSLSVSMVVVWAVAAAAAAGVFV